MLKEIKYLIFVSVILLFIFFTGKYYFSDEHKKKSYISGYAPATKTETHTHTHTHTQKTEGESTNSNL